MSHEVRDSYDANAGLYARFALDDLDRVHTDRAWLARFAELTDLRDGAVADLGCGPGHIVDHLTDLGVAATGYDISPEMIAEARCAFPDSEFHVGDLGALDIATSSLAGIVSRYSLIHVPPAELDGIFREWFRVLAPGAPLLVSFFAASSAGTHGSPFDHAIVTAYALFSPTIAVGLQQAGFVDSELGTRPPLDGERALDHGTILARRGARPISTGVGPQLIRRGGCGFRATAPPSTSAGHAANGIQPRR
ncbi:class I SAM-dependent methyltransferase [Ilumatobacter sp.]|uniref:class I SAM-dependent methyltransferase n=1 Tax=Ilumatobacter sp. TaxID=1967498 RepID=UPI003C41B401